MMHGSSWIFEVDNGFHYIALAHHHRIVVHCKSRTGFGWRTCPGEFTARSCSNAPCMSWVISFALIRGGTIDRHPPVWNIREWCTFHQFPVASVDIRVPVSKILCRLRQGVLSGGDSTASRTSHHRALADRQSGGFRLVKIRGSPRGFVSNKNAHTSSNFAETF